MFSDDIPIHLPTISLIVVNMHCPSCVESISQLLAPMSGLHNLSISLLLRRITFSVDTSTSSSFQAVSVRTVVNQVKQLLTSEGGFIVTEAEGNGIETNPPDNGRKLSLLGNWHSKKRDSKEERLSAERRLRHLERCETCRHDSDRYGSGFSPQMLPAPTESGQILETIVSIEGMTCASCTATITSALTSHSSIISVNINLLSSSGNIRHKARLPASELLELIDEVGFEASVISTIPEAAAQDGHNTVHTLLSIQGMTCVSCSSAIERSLRECPEVLEVYIDVLGNSGTVIHSSEVVAERLKRIIDDTGYDATIVNSFSVDSIARSDRSLRTITVQVQGVFCNNCISQLNTCLKTMPLKTFTPMSLNTPETTISYVPRSPLTIRSILKELSDLAPEFEAKVVHAPSLSERSQNIQRREARYLLNHLAVAVFFAIPTFIIAIVGMVILPSSSKFRSEWMAPVWGGANLGTLILWALATIVQFGVGRLFYRRTFNSMRPHLRRLVPFCAPASSIQRMPSHSIKFRNFFSFGSMDLLVTLSTSVSYFSSIAMLAIDIQAGPQAQSVGTYFDSCVFLIMFILLGRTLEAYAKSRTTDSVAILGTLRPDTALLIEEQATSDETTSSSVQSNPSEGNLTLPTRAIPIDQVELGDILLIPPGSLPPTDGIIVSGSTKFDESSLTGESRPVSKKCGDQVFTGTSNQNSAITIRVTSVAADTMLERIIRAVSDASGRKAPIEKVAERLTGAFVPIIVYLSLAVFLIWLSVVLSGSVSTENDINSGGRVFFAIEFAISCLVVACPCGIGLAVPCANAVGTGMAAALGILAAGGGEAFTAATGVTTIAFDKTGTLTVGKSLVTDEYYDLQPHVTREMLCHAIHDIETQSTHPLAVGLVNHLKESVTKDAISISESREIAGRGLRAAAVVSGVNVELLIGNATLLEENGVSFTEDVTARMSEWTEDAKSIVLVAVRSNNEGSYLLAAMFAMSDPPRPTASAVVANLRKRGFKLVMLSGDNGATARAVARAIGIDDVHADAGPEGKADFIREIQSRNVAKPSSIFSWYRRSSERREVVMFIGDGLNDSVALAAADVSVAMGHGSQATLACADFILLSSSIDSLLLLLTLSRKVKARQRFNLFWAMVFNVVCLPFAAGVFYPLHGIRLSPVWSAVLMALSSVSVVCSSLALRWGL